MTHNTQLRLESRNDVLQFVFFHFSFCLLSFFSLKHCISPPGFANQQFPVGNKLHACKMLFWDAVVGFIMATE